MKEFVLLSACRQENSDEENGAYITLLRRHIEAVGLFFTPYSAWVERWGSEYGFMIESNSGHFTNEQRFHIDSFATMFFQDSYLLVRDGIAHEVVPNLTSTVLGRWKELDYTLSHMPEFIKSGRVSWTRIRGTYYTVEEV